MNIRSSFFTITLPLELCQLLHEKVQAHPISTKAFSLLYFTVYYDHIKLSKLKELLKFKNDELKLIH